MLATPRHVRQRVGAVLDRGGGGQRPVRAEGLGVHSPVERAAPSLHNAANVSMKDNDTGFRCVTMS